MTARVKPRNLVEYQRLNGKKPLDDWISSISDHKTQAIIHTRIDRLRTGNMGSCKNLRDGLYELIINYGPGYRIYFTTSHPDFIVLLFGGLKNNQRGDIKQARSLLSEWEDSQP